MISRHHLRGSLTTLFALGTLAAARPAAAAPTSCVQDTDCSKGFTCQVVGASACPAYACAMTTGTAPDAQACPPPPACNPQVIKGCLPGPCSTDSDCATGMVCYTDSYTSCPAPAPLPSCPPNAACAVPVEDAGACTTMTTKSCVPRYDLPCQVASDCGPGFTCVPDTVTSCSGGGPTGTGGTGGLSSGAPASVDAGSSLPSCTVTPSSTSSCQAMMIQCATAADCPSTWSCVAQAQPVTNVCAGPVSVDGSAPPCRAPNPGPPQLLCEPPYAGLGTTGGGSFSSGSGGGSVPAAGANAPSGGGASSSGPGASGSSGGCQVATPGAASGGFSLFAVLGLTALSRRRRPQSRS